MALAVRECAASVLLGRFRGHDVGALLDNLPGHRLDVAIVGNHGHRLAILPTDNPPTVGPLSAVVGLWGAEGLDEFDADVITRDKSVDLKVADIHVQ